MKRHNIFTIKEKLYKTTKNLNSPTNLIIDIKRGIVREAQRITLQDFHLHPCIIQKSGRQGRWKILKELRQFALAFGIQNQGNAPKISQVSTWIKSEVSLIEAPRKP